MTLNNIKQRKTFLKYMTRTHCIQYLFTIVQIVPMKITSAVILTQEVLLLTIRVIWQNYPNDEYSYDQI